MDTNRPEDDDDDDDETEDEDEDDEDESITPRRKRASGLVTPTRKPKNPQKPTAKKTRAKKPSKKDTTQQIISATDDDATPRPTKRQQNLAISPSVEIPQFPAESTLVSRSKPRLASSKSNAPGGLPEIPDSAGEEHDIWILSSDED